SRAISMVAAVGRDMDGRSVLSRGLNALAEHGLEAIGATQGPRQVDVQFIVERDQMKSVIRSLHGALVQGDRKTSRRAA
ncbi:MAG: aspartate kinase, partial [Paracoccus sp. (in: a-proteobacteria)]